MSEKRTVRALCRLGEKVYVYLKDAETGAAFLRAAEAEGFTFGDGAKPTDRHFSAVMAVKPDGKVNYVGAVGMMAFGAAAADLVRIDFSKYLGGTAEYFMENL